MNINDMRGNGGSALEGVEFVQESSKLHPYQLSWKKPTIFKPFGCPTDDGQGIQPQFDPANPGQLTDWITSAPIARSVGQMRKITFNTDLPRDEQSQFNETPYERFYRVLKEASKKDNRIETLLFKGGNGTGACVPRAANCGIMQGVLYMHNGKDFTQQGNSAKANICMLLSASATGALANLIEWKNPDGSVMIKSLFGNQPNISFYFTQSDTATMLPPGWQVFVDMEAQQGPNPSAKQNSSGFQSYTCKAVVPPPHIQVPTVQYNLANWKPWNKVVKVMGAQEQINLIATAFDPAIVMMAFEGSEFEAYVPAFIKNASRVINFNMQPISYQQQPQQGQQGQPQQGYYNNPNPAYSQPMNQPQQTWQNPPQGYQQPMQGYQPPAAPMQPGQPVWQQPQVQGQPTTYTNVPPTNGSVPNGMTQMPNQYPPPGNSNQWQPPVQQVPQGMPFNMPTGGDEEMQGMMPPMNAQVPMSIPMNQPGVFNPNSAMTNLNTSGPVGVIDPNRLNDAQSRLQSVLAQQAMRNNSPATTQNFNPAGVR